MNITETMDLNSREDTNNQNPGVNVVGMSILDSNVNVSDLINKRGIYMPKVQSGFQTINTDLLTATSKGISKYGTKEEVASG